MLNGGVKHYGGDHNTEMAHASKEEAAQLSVEENKRIKEAQKEVLVLLIVLLPLRICPHTHTAKDL